MRKIFQTSIVLLLLALPPQAGAATPSGQIDFAKPAQANNQLGFMHGRLADYRVADSNPLVMQRATELQPGLWRGANRNYSFDSDLVQQVGAAPIHILSNLWMNLRPDQTSGCKEKFIYDMLPFQDWAVWESFVKEKALEIAARQPTGPIWFDVWNEPDWWTMWPIRSNPKCFPTALLDRNFSLWMQTYARADRVLRKTLGARAKIVAPSTASDVIGYTHKLALYCARAGCRIDAIGWHMAGGTQASVDLIGSRTAEMRTRMIKDATWKKVMGGKTIPIWMTEYMPYDNRWMSGTMISFWYAMERTKIDGGAFAEWSDQDSRLNGLLDLNGITRPSWWAARSYALGRTSRVVTSARNTYYSLIAHRQGLSGKPEILLGNNNASAKSVPLSISGLRQAGIADASKVLVKIFSIPESKGKVMPALPAPTIKYVRVSGGKTSLSLAPSRGGSLIIQIG